MAYAVGPACLSIGFRGLCGLYQCGHWEFHLCTGGCLMVISSVYVTVWESLLYVNNVLLLL